MDNLTSVWMPPLGVHPFAVSPTWPWTGETTVQGFLANRWLRRSGTVYGALGTGYSLQPNSPIRGGEDEYARVSTSSGEPRS